MEHFSNMRTTACTFDEMRNQLNKVQGTCAFNCVEGYYNVCMHASSHMFRKNVEVSTFFSRQFINTVTYFREKNKVPDL